MSEKMSDQTVFMSEKVSDQAVFMSEKMSISGKVNPPCLAEKAYMSNEW